MAETVKMTIKPMPEERFSFVKGRFESVFGTYKSEWSCTAEKGFRYHIEIPFCANAEVIFPNGRSYILQNGAYHFDNDGERL